jgi:DGQHR domain-containing protein
MSDEILNLEDEETLEDYFCQRGTFTNVTYYFTALSLSEAAEGLSFENDVLTNGSFAERMQRNINEKRAKEEIYEGYLKHDGTRFFNSLVVTFVPEKDDDEGFLKVKELGKDFVKLSIKKNTKKFVLDGQHRLFALKKLREDVDLKKVNNSELKNIKVPVVFVTFSNLNNELGNKNKIRDEIVKESRSIFVSLNKTAKKIDKYTALITDDSDLSAVSARKILEDNYVAEIYVKWSIPNHALAQNDPYFTTLNFLNDCFEICESNFNDLEDSEKILLSNEEREKIIAEKYFDFVEELGFAPSILIKDFFIKLDFFNNWKNTLSYLKLPKQPELLVLTMEDKRVIKELRQDNILATIAGQKALFTAIVDVYNFMGKNTKEKNELLFKRINELERLDFFKRNNEIWKLILVRNDKNKSMIFKVSNISYAAKLISLIIRKKESEFSKFYDDITYELGVDNNIKLLDKYI